MSADAAYELQKGLKTALAAAAAVTALLAGGANSILDDVPENQTLPYITIGDIQSENDETFTEMGQAHVVTIHVWASRVSRAGGSVGYEGRKGVRDILSAVYAALNHATLTLAGFVNTNMTYSLSQVFREDGDTYHGIIRFRAVTEPV